MKKPSFINRKSVFVFAFFQLISVSSYSKELILPFKIEAYLMNRGRYEKIEPKSVGQEYGYEIPANAGWMLRKSGKEEKEFDDSHLEQIVKAIHNQSIEEFRRINLWGTSVTENGLACLGELTFLEWVWFSSDQLSDKSLVYLKKLKRLESLYLQGPRISDAGLHEIKELPNLTELGVLDTRITSQGFASLSSFPALKKIVVGGGEIGDADLSSLVKLRFLEELNLSGDKFSDRVLSAIEKFPKLKVLNLNCTQITKDGASQFSETRKDVHVERDCIEPDI